jgi:CheY-like chemotaxis protein
MARILLVDDEKSIIDFVSYNLEKHGNDVVVAQDGEVARLDAGPGDAALLHQLVVHPVRALDRPEQHFSARRRGQGNAAASYRVRPV